MWNIIIGLVFIVLGLSGKVSLIGTNSPQLLAVLGAGLLIWGIVQVVKSRSKG